MALASLSGAAVVYRTGGAVGSEWSNWRLGGGVGRGEAWRPSRIVDPRWTERGGGDERNGVFEGGAGAADNANPLRTAVK